jgi:hypothetical protein
MWPGCGAPGSDEAEDSADASFTLGVTSTLATIKPRPLTWFITSLSSTVISTPPRPLAPCPISFPELVRAAPYGLKSFEEQFTAARECGRLAAGRKGSRMGSTITLSRGSTIAIRHHDR